MLAAEAVQQVTHRPEEQRLHSPAKMGASSLHCPDWELYLSLQTGSIHQCIMLCQSSHASRGKLTGSSPSHHQAPWKARIMKRVMRAIVFCMYVVAYCLAHLVMWLASSLRH